MFKREDYNPRKSLYAVGAPVERRMSSAQEGADRKPSLPLPSSTGDLRGGPARGADSSPTNRDNNNLPITTSTATTTSTSCNPTVANSDYWFSVSSFIGSFLKR